MRILITNDDGVHAEGILALKQALEPLGEVFVVAPDRPRSASGHSITLHKPLRLKTVKLADGSKAYASNGTPADCVSLGLGIVMEHRCDFLISGINSGANLGWDLTYSGTVSAAIEGAILGVRSLAISVCELTEGEILRYDGAGWAARELVSKLSKHEIPKHTLFNANVPNLAPDRIKGFQVTRQGSRQYSDRLLPREDPWGQPYYWLGGSLVDERAQEGTDVHAIQSHFVSITPVHLDLTAYTLLDATREWIEE